MLATETQEVADYIKQTMMDTFGDTNLKEHFADTRDTLCYDTNDNQDTTYGLLEKEVDLAIVVGGYNSSKSLHKKIGSIIIYRLIEDERTKPSQL